MELQGSVRLIFQPAEEGGAGGDLMVREGSSLGDASLLITYRLAQIVYCHCITDVGDF